jgi:hypothetical protein
MLTVKAYATSNELNSVTEKKGFFGLFEMAAYLWQTKRAPRLKIRKKRYVNRKGWWMRDKDMTAARVSHCLEQGG